jgi:hypothetical protein
LITKKTLYAIYPLMICPSQEDYTKSAEEIHRFMVEQGIAAEKQVGHGEIELLSVSKSLRHVVGRPTEYDDETALGISGSFSKVLGGGSRKREISAGTFKEKQPKVPRWQEAPYSSLMSFFPPPPTIAGPSSIPPPPVVRPPVAGPSSIPPPPVVGPPVAGIPRENLTLRQARRRRDGILKSRAKWEKKLVEAQTRLVVLDAEYEEWSVFSSHGLCNLPAGSGPSRLIGTFSPNR